MFGLSITYLTPQAIQDAEKVKADSIAARELRAVEEIGMIWRHEDPDHPVFANLVGKSYQVPFDFMRGWEGGGGNKPDPLNTNSPTFAGLAGDLAIPVIIVLVVGAFVYVAVKRGRE